MRTTIAVMLVAALILVLVPFLPNGLDTFETDAVTDRIVIRASNQAPSWSLDPESTSIAPLIQDCEPLRFLPSSGAFIEVVSNPSDLPSIIISGEEMAGQVECSDLRLEATATDIEFILADLGDAARPYVLRVDGEVTIGSDSDLYDISPPILRSGQIEVINSPMPFLSARTRALHMLTPGDRVQFLTTEKEASRDQARSLGVILPASSGPMRVLVRTEAQRAAILHFGSPQSDAISLAPSFLSRLQSSAEYILIFPIGWLLWKVAVMYFQLVRRQTAQERSIEANAKAARKIDRKIRRNLLLVAALSAFILPNVASATDIGLIEGEGPAGQALIFESGDVCRALTADHVLDGRDRVIIRLEDRRILSADVRTRIGDIAMLEIMAPGEYECPPWSHSNEIETALDSTAFQARAVSRMGMNRISLTIRQDNEGYLIFAPAYETDKERLEQGISGSTVFAADQPLGIVTAVDPFSGEVSVVRLDIIVQLFPSSFNTAHDASAPEVHASESTARNNGGVTAPTTIIRTPAPQQDDLQLQRNKVQLFLQGYHLRTATMNHIQAIANYNASIQVQDGMMSLTRIDFTLVNDYVENQPLGDFDVEGQEFGLCANLQNTSTRSRSMADCANGFIYRRGESFFTTGNASIDLDLANTCDAEAIINNACRVWLYVYPSWEETSGYGGAVNLNQLIAVGNLTLPD